MINKNSLITAISMMAVIFIAISFSGCVTSRHIDELKAEHREIKAQIAAPGEKIAKMEQLIFENTEASKKLRNDVSGSTNQLQQQMDALLENYNELLRLVQEINAQVHSKKVILGSVGDTRVEQQPTQTTNSAVLNQVPEKPSADCGKLYDDSFVLFRSGENYENAIVSFNTYIETCPKHPSVENAHYWIGESYYALGKYVDASTKFEFLLKEFKGTINASRAIYKLARCKQELGKNKEAKQLFQKLIDEYPESLEASQAKDLIKAL